MKISAIRPRPQPILSSPQDRSRHGIGERCRPGNSGGDKVRRYDRQLIHAEHGQIDGVLLILPRQNLAELPASAAHSHTLAPAKRTRRANTRLRPAALATQPQ